MPSHNTPEATPLPADQIKELTKRLDVMIQMIAPISRAADMILAEREAVAAAQAEVKSEEKRGKKSSRDE